MDEYNALCKQKLSQADDSNGNMMFCKYCGKRIEADSLYCKYCGKKL